MHIYDARFPAAPGARLVPPDALVPAYAALQSRLGLQRCVVVTPSTYGQDNRCTVEAIRALNASGVQARGIAVLSADVDEATLASLHAEGVRGVRFNQTLGGLSLDDLEPLAERIAPLGWHVELLLPAALWPQVATRLQRLPVPLVFDHLGRLPHPGREHPGHHAILALLDTGRAWVKLSGAYLQDGTTPAQWSADAQAMARAYLHVAPHRMVWGSNWPHPTVHAGLHAAPDEAELLALLRRWTADDVTWRRALVDNPTDLYNF
ncbi:amidohydrolase [Piscinibacter sp. HJYY11]|uniref:amidohydrolase family protein n=1 Tax=Piscinibacter sp. HJYY11 TaxID=2801333 RepID=UPI00191E3623|nr:amidohydrolase family protein [Piscinibacter sp. HJYY11]MBL0730655.1 amidohydrolase family protein [Piscinibacter sp. HJYY11]